PLDEAHLIIAYQNNEKKSYKGDRFFEAELSANPKLFFPIRVESQHGKGTLLYNKVENGRRLFGVRVEGNFDDVNSILADIIGIPGLSDLDTTYIEFTQKSIFWGSNVNTTSLRGVLKIDANCPGRKILDLP